MNFYNDIDPTVCAWTSELIRAGLIPPGDVVCKSIKDIQPDELKKYDQCHFFNGVSGWALAGCLAGIQSRRSVFFMSCPCQPFSCAGKGEGVNDERHLWPEGLRLIKACAPEIVFGEQVASAEVVGSQLEAAFVDAVQRGDFARANRFANQLVKSHSLHYHQRWLDGVQAGLARIGYTVGATIIGAHSASAPHKRQRLYWMAVAQSQLDRRGPERQGRRIESANGVHVDGMAEHQSQGRPRVESECATGQQQRTRLGSSGATNSLGDRQQPRLEGHAGHGHNGDQPGRDGARAAGPVAEAGALVPVGQPDRSGRHPGRPATEAAGYGSAVEPAGIRIGSVAESNGRRDNASLSQPDERGLSPQDGRNYWSNFRIIQIRDGTFRRIPDAQSVFQRLADVAPAYLDAMRDLGASEAEIKEVWEACGGFPLAGKIPGRVSLLKGSGNAIVPELAAQFIRAAMEAVEDCAK